jgi:PAS domain-containing protein
METHECMVLNIRATTDVFELVRQALGGITEVGCIEASDFASIEIRENSEIGLVFIPVDESTDLLPYEALAQSCSKQSANLSVLLVASSNEVAKKIELADFFDGLICLEWSTSAALIRKAFADYKIRTENRALKIFMDHSVDGYWIWDIRRDRIEWSHRTSELVGLKTDLAPKNMEEFVELIRLK